MQNAECKMQDEYTPQESISGLEDDTSLDDVVEEEVTVKEDSTPTPTKTNSNKAHLTSSVPKAARVPTGALTKGEMAEIREIFGDIDDAEIQRLYKRVTK